MTKKENLNKVIDYLEEIEKKEKETETNLDSEKIFMKIKNATNIKYHSDFSVILKTLIENFEIEKSKDPLPNDKRSYPYRLIDKSLREKRKLEKMFYENKSFNLENNQTIIPLLKEIITKVFTKENIRKEFNHKSNITFEEFAFIYSLNVKELGTYITKENFYKSLIQKYELTDTKIELIQKHAFEILDFLIFKRLGLNIIFSSKDKTYFDHLEKDRKYTSKKIYFLSVIGPLIAAALQIHSSMLSIKKPEEPFQIMINFIPEKDLDIEFKNLKNNILKSELMTEGINDNNDLSNYLSLIKSNETRINQLKADMRDIISPMFFSAFQNLLFEYLMNFWKEYYGF